MTLRTQQTVDYLDKAIARAAADGGGRLPTTRAMASGAGVSQATMARAVKRLQAVGTLYAIARGGLMLTGAPPPAQPVVTQRLLPAALGATERVRRAIAADIAKQEFPPGSVLPDYKLMAGRYGGSYRTLRNALLMLLEERRLTAHGRGFQVSSLPAPASAAGIVVIAQTDDTAVLSHFTPRSPQLWRCLEE
jgi:DNA-binding GntR family transcriptional regulator